MAKANGNLDLQGVYQLLNARLQVLTSDPTDPADGQVWVNSTETRLKIRLGGVTETLADLGDIAGAGGGDMLAGTYDPTGVAADAFSRTNHTGTQPSSTISDFAAAADARAQAIVDAVVDAAPGTLDTLNELAAALGDDPNFAATITADVAAKAAVQSQLIGDGVATVFNVAHGAAGAAAVGATALRVEATGEEIAIWDRTVDATNIVVTISPAPAVDEFRVVWTA